MRRRIVYLLPVCLGLLTAACADQTLGPSDDHTMSATAPNNTTAAGKGDKPAKGGSGGTGGSVKGTGK